MFKHLPSPVQVWALCLHSLSNHHEKQFHSSDSPRTPGRSKHKILEEQILNQITLDLPKQRPPEGETQKGKNSVVTERQ